MPGFVISVWKVLREDGRAVGKLLFDLGLGYLVLPPVRHDFFRSSLTMLIIHSLLKFGQGCCTQLL